MCATPPGWVRCPAAQEDMMAEPRYELIAELTLKRAALDYQGEPCADGSLRFDLCPTCHDKIDAAVEAVCKP